MSDHFSVTVRRNGEEVVTIESNCLSGRDISSADEQAIYMAALNLLGFIGQPKPALTRKLAAGDHEDVA